MQDRTNRHDDELLTVKAVADLAGVSTRTLRYYDQIDLLKPAQIGANSYRYYDTAAILRLQQILFFRELGFELKTIKALLDRPDFDYLRALEQHRSELTQRARRLERLLQTLDKTIQHLKGERTMSNDELFEAFSDEQRAEYEQEAREMFGDARVEATNQRWNSYSQQQQDAIKAQGDAIFRAIRDHMDEGHSSPAVQEQIAALQQHIGNFYECPLECLRGLGQMYVDHPDFNATFERIRPGLAEFIRQAIDHYCDTHAE
jgi:DNA-binding transcriptional MerR regulator